MDEAVGICAIFTALLILVALIAKLALFCRAFSEETRHICRGMDCAGSDEEYRRWRGELYRHYLTLIPFVNEKNVTRLYDRIFHKKDSANTRARKDGLVPLLLPSVLAMCLCAACLCGMTWAWFTVSVEAPPQKITSAYYAVEVKVEEWAEEPVTDSAEETDDPETKPENINTENINRYSLEGNTRYRVILTAKGGDSNRGGYCLIECGDWKGCTRIIRPGEKITIELQTGPAGGVYTFTGVWGIPDGNCEKITEEPDANTDGETTPEPVDSPEPATYETATNDPVIPEPETTAPQAETPAEGDSAAPSDPVSSDTPATDPA